MIPERAEHLDDMIAEGRRQLDEVEELVTSLSPEALTWRPDRRKWSAIGHIEHMCLVNEPYVDAMRGRLVAARAKGSAVESEGPYRHPRLAMWFVRSMEPPPKRRFRTGRAMTPETTAEVSEVVRRFAAAQRGLVELMGHSRGIDLGRVRFGSPFLSLLRLSLGTGFEALLAHNRRHIWLIREVLGSEGSPAPG